MKIIIGLLLKNIKKNEIKSAKIELDFFSQKRTQGDAALSLHYVQLTLAQHSVCGSGLGSPLSHIFAPVGRKNIAYAGTLGNMSLRSMLPNGVCMFGRAPRHIA
jgi:hypothetical protein